MGIGIVSLLKNIWTGDEETRQRVLIASAILVAAGIGLIVVGVAVDWGWSRLPGAIAISLGGAAGGAAVGLSRPARERFWAKLTGWRVRIAAAGAVIIVAPVFLAMASAAFGPLFGGGDASDTALVVLGAILGFIMMVGTFLAGVIAVHATIQRVTPASVPDDRPEESS